jgi:zinc protease
VDGIVDGGIQAEELQRAQAIVETEFLAAMQVASDRADKLSMFATYFRKPELINEQVERYSAVTPDEVDAFIRSYLVKENRATLLYVPAPGALSEAAA